MIRLVVNFDFATDDPGEAYAALRRMLDGDEANEPPLSLGWETSDEWYNTADPESDNGANPSDPNLLNMAIGRWIDERGV